MQDLDAANITWRNYFELIPTSWQFQYTRTKLENYNLFEQFAIDAANGNLASYSACLAPLCLFGVAITAVDTPKAPLGVECTTRGSILCPAYECGSVCVCVCPCLPAFIDPQYNDFLG